MLLFWFRLSDVDDIRKKRRCLVTHMGPKTHTFHNQRENKHRHVHSARIRTKAHTQQTAASTLISINTLHCIRILFWTLRKSKQRNENKLSSNKQSKSN